MTPRRAIITGASSGIGRAIMGRLARRGDRVLALGRDAEKLRAAIAELGPAAASVDAAVLDVRDTAALRERLSSEPRIDALVLSAGVCRQARLDAEDADGVWDEVMATNASAVYQALRAALPRVPEGGRVVVISSGLGKVGRAGYAAYCASKHAVLGLVRCAALEVATRGVTVNAVCPGWVDTPMSAADIEQTAATAGEPPAAVRAHAERAIPVGRFVAAAEVAALVEWLLSSDAAAVTGEAWNITGGELAV